jgi:hypothetical protein
MWMVQINPVGRLIMYWSTPSAYGIRFFDADSGAFTIKSHSSLATAAIHLRDPITLGEHQELSALRQAHAWGAPIFQPSHPNCGKAMSRLAELETKERGDLRQTVAKELDG